ncbi:CDP-alcohol phosphatidyltransferase family protein [Variovorax sp.]|uniref:CDP-alcohol phosphatidyltransferase family protein n=1 Tax=Variovorax sp. TaxID=1871043 RepID=UPI002D22D275|nr:CDP-alcohol phosphatidyltransferase family protein [Variovorax sp.]HYP85512.1 CDP-alcohol phosphatidyltransferase family protein [Variovorax sp.]
MPSSPPPVVDSKSAAALLRRSAARASVAAALVLGLAAAALVAWLDAGAALALQALAVFALGVGCMFKALARHLPHGRFGAANGLTLGRLAMIALLAGLVGRPLPSDLEPLAWAVVVFATTAAVLDAVDGPLARAQKLASDFGARFDMESDALLVMVLSLLAWHFGKAGAWVLLAGLARYLFVAAAWAWPWMARPLPPSLRRKTVCVVQITCLIVCLGPIITRPWSQAVAAASLGLLLLSFAADVRWLSRQRQRPSLLGDPA